MESQWDRDGNAMDRDGTAMGSGWSRNGVGMGAQWESDGVAMGTQWSRDGNAMGSRWERNGVEMGFFRKNAVLAGGGDLARRLDGERGCRTIDAIGEIGGLPATDPNRTSDFSRP